MNTTHGTHFAGLFQGIGNMLADHYLVQLARTPHLLVRGEKFHPFPHLPYGPTDIETIVTLHNGWGLKLQRHTSLQLPRFVRHDEHVLQMSVLNKHPIGATQMHFIALHGFDDTRVRKRFLPCRSPPNRFCPGVSIDDLLTHFDCLVPPKPIGQLRPLLRCGSIPTEDLCSDLPIGLEKVLGMLRHWLEIQHLEGLQLLFQRNRTTPPTVNVPRRKSMRARSVVHQKLHYRQ